MFVRVCRVGPGAPWWPLCCVRFVRVRLDSPGAPWGSLGSYGFVGFIRVRLGGR